MLANTTQIKVNYGRPNSNYQKMRDFLDRKIVNAMPFNSVQRLTFSGTNNLVQSLHFFSVIFFK